MKTLKELRSEMNRSSGVIPAPIHFRHVGDGKSDIPEENIQEEHIDSWLRHNDNNHIPRRTPIEDVLGSAENLNPDEKRNINQYTRSSRKLNIGLINGRLHENQEKHAKHLDNAIDKNKIKERVHVYSGIGFDPTKHMNEKGQLHSPAYISTSHDKSVANRFATPNDDCIHHIMHLYLPKGSPAMHIPEHVSGLSEKEVLVKRGATLQHDGHSDYEHATRKYRIHRMFLVPPDKE